MDVDAERLMVLSSLISDVVASFLGTPFVMAAGIQQDRGLATFTTPLTALATFPPAALFRSNDRD